MMAAVEGDTRDVEPASGRLVGARHSLAVRVYFEDTDAAGIVYYANYLKFLERGRTDMMRLLGIRHTDLMNSIGNGAGNGDGGALFPVKKLEVDYLTPARLDDALTVTTSVEKVSGASMTMDQIITRGSEEVLRARVRLACIGLDGRVRRLPAAVRDAVQSINGGEAGVT